MKRSSAVRLLVVYLVLCLSATAAQQAAKEKVIVGVLKDDGTIMPFARYDGLHWSTWDGDPPMDPATLPTTPPLSQIPKEWRVPSTWRVWLPSSGSVHEIHVTGLQSHKTNCDESDWGFGTDFPKALNSSPVACPDTMIGLALSTDLPMERFMQRPADQVPSASLNRAFTQAESPKISELNRLDRESWLRVPIRVAQVYGSEMLYFIEANKRYKRNWKGEEITVTRDDCPQISAFQGWFMNDNVLSSTLDVTDCDYKNVTSTTPLGLIHLKSGNYVIVQRNDYESQWYGILKIQSGSVSVVIGR